MIRNLLFITMLLLSQQFTAAQSSLLRNDEVEITADLSESPLFTAPLPVNGAFSGFHSEGRYRYSGQLRNKQLHGNWTSWYSSAGTYEEGRFSKGLPDGSWKVWHENGQLKYLRTYSSDKYRRIKHEFRNPHPRMVLYPITRLYLQDKKTALKELNAQQQFPGIETAIPYQPLFTEALLHGPFQSYSENGRLLVSGQYSNGLREGIWLETDLQGNTWKGHYKHGHREGSWKLVDSSGTILKLVDFQKGISGWEKEYK